MLRKFSTTNTSGIICSTITNPNTSNFSIQKSTITNQNTSNLSIQKSKIKKLHFIKLIYGY